MNAPDQPIYTSQKLYTIKPKTAYSEVKDPASCLWPRKWIPDRKYEWDKQYITVLFQNLFSASSHSGFLSPGWCLVLNSLDGYFFHESTQTLLNL